LQQVKIFEGNGNNEVDINWWIECNPNYKIINMNMIPMHDKYPNGDICNQWVSTIVIYEDGR
jgi:hypothetical protein